MAAPQNKPDALAYTSVPHARVAFGRYPFPVEQALSDLLASGFTVFIDCTQAHESVVQYDKSTVPVYYSYPVADQSAPNNMPAFRGFARSCVDNLGPNDKVYVHCRGGHGRAAVVAACLLLQLQVVDTGDAALRAVQDAHNKRGVVRARWRKLGCPQNATQKQFVRQFAGLSAGGRIEFYEAKGKYGCFSNFFPAPIRMPDGQSWATTEHYFQAHKFLGPLASTVDCEYASTIRSADTANKVAMLARQKKKGGWATKWKVHKNGARVNDAIDEYRRLGAKLRSDWPDEKERVMYDAVLAKFKQHKDLARVLLSTGSQILVEHTCRDAYWGDGGNGQGRNRLGHILMKVRSDLMAETATADAKLSNIHPSITQPIKKHGLPRESITNRGGDSGSSRPLKRLRS